MTQTCALCAMAFCYSYHSAVYPPAMQYSASRNLFVHMHATRHKHLAEVGEVTELIAVFVLVIQYFPPETGFLCVHQAGIELTHTSLPPYLPCLCLLSARLKTYFQTSKIISKMVYLITWQYKTLYRKIIENLKNKKVYKTIMTKRWFPKDTQRLLTHFQLES